MTISNNARRHPLATACAAIALSVSLTACFGGDDEPTPTPTPPPAATPAPTPAPTTAGYDVAQCLGQSVPGTGKSVAGLVVPDVLGIAPSAPAGFPNGRLLADPVIDVTLAIVFLDVNAPGQSPLTFANIPLNPPANDKPFRDTFPYLALPHGNPPLSATTGTAFNFRVDPASAYARVDRMGMPAVSTALIPSDRKIAYNDADPVDDAEGVFVPDLAGQLTALTDGIGDDLLSLGLNICAD